MLPADAADANPTFPSFGLLGSTAAFVPIPVGNATVKLSRTVGNEVVYAAPPPGHGIGVTRWDKDPLAGPNGYAVKLPTADLRPLVSVRQWRRVYAESFPDGWVNHRHSPAAKQLTEFARGLLTHTAALHRHGWRLGLLSPDTVYLSSSDPARVFLPDLGFAWVGQMALTKPAWLGTEPTDLHLWGEERKVRQFCAPEQYRTRHPSAKEPAELVQQDLRVVAQLLAFMLTGHVGGAEPAGARKCPVWNTIRAAAAGKFIGTDDVSPAEQMLEHLLTGLKAPLDIAPPAYTEPKKGGAGLLFALLFVALVLGGGALGIWWLWQKGMETATAPSDSSPSTDTTPATGETPPTTGTQPPPTTPMPPAPGDPPGDIVELAKKSPAHPKVVAELDRLRKARKEAYAAARNGAADAARLARELQDQIDRIVAAQNTQEVPK
jgi:hypothetical protein